jgi:phosphatidylserine decarboxylase
MVLYFVGVANPPVTRTGFDMDPFVIVSFGKKTFRTHVIRHSLNPVFNERLIFQVMNPEKHYVISFSVYDRDKMSSNDFVAQAFLPMSDLINNASTPDPETGLYKVNEPWKDPELTQPKAKRQDSKLSRILSRSSSSTNLSSKKNSNKSGTSTPIGSIEGRTSTIELTRSLSSTSLSNLAGKLSIELADLS